MKAITVFHGHGDTLWARLFGRAGFRHCYVALACGDYWVEIDGRIGLPVIKVATGASFDLASHYRAQGYTVIETETHARVPLQPLMLGTCVGMVKRILGIRSPWVLTPWRLYRFLSEQGAFSNGQ
ncbi:MAG: hypothetical protein RIB59_13785 [Rhodospirillales bacterium]